MTRRKYSIIRKSAILITLAGWLALSGCSGPHVAERATHEHREPTRDVAYPVELRHPAIDSNKPNQYTLYQIQSSEDLVVGYKLGIDSVTCEQRMCTVVKVSIFWDALGQYMSFRVEDEKRLQKVSWGGANIANQGAATSAAKGVPFTDADNELLDKILRDHDSVLKGMKFSALLEGRENDKLLKLDAVTRPTPLSLQQAVVKGAALSCYQLWHYTHGEVVPNAVRLTQQQCDTKQLKAFLLSDHPHYVLFALDSLIEHQPVDPALLTYAIRVAGAADPARLEKGLELLRVINKDIGQHDSHMALMYQASTTANRIILLQRLGKKERIEAEFLDELSRGLGDTQSYHELDLFLKLIARHNYDSPLLASELSRLSKSNNRFVKRRVNEYLNQQKQQKMILRTDGESE